MVVDDTYGIRYRVAMYDEDAENTHHLMMLQMIEERIAELPNFLSFDIELSLCECRNRAFSIRS